MNQKQFDHIENKIREAAESNEYAFDEGAWDKMKLLLDKNDASKRRPFFWWWVGIGLLLISTTAGYFLFTSNRENNTVTSITKTTDHSTNELINNISGKNTKTITATKNTNTADIKSAAQILQKGVNQSIKSTVFFGTGEKKSGTTKKPYKQKSNATSNNEVAVRGNEGRMRSKLQNGEMSSEDEGNNVTRPVKEEKVEQPTMDRQNVKEATVKDTTGTVKHPGNKEKKKAKGLYFIAAAGIEAASVDFLSFDNSSVSGRYGAGIGYQLNKRFSLQTGFYASRKKYVAGSGDYKVPPDFTYSADDITKVDANCLIYEIPVTVRYDFLQKGKTVFYATAGLSSLIMKNEAYHYFYYWENIPYEESKSYTGNKHLFSVLSFSAGIEQKISGKLSLLAEPAVTLPLAGVGEGSVKLYSAYLQVGLKYKPFNK